MSDHWEGQALGLARRVGAFRGTVMGAIILLDGVDDVWTRAVRKMLTEALADDDRRAGIRESPSVTQARPEVET